MEERGDGETSTSTAVQQRGINSGHESVKEETASTLTGKTVQQSWTVERKVKGLAIFELYTSKRSWFSEGFGRL